MSSSQTDPAASPTISLPMRPLNPRREIGISVIAMLVTVIAFAMYAWHMTVLTERLHLAGRQLDVVHAIAFAAAVGVLVYGNVLYQITRLGYYVRRTRFAHPDYRS